MDLVLLYIVGGQGEGREVRSVQYTGMTRITLVGVFQSLTGDGQLYGGGGRAVGIILYGECWICTKSDYMRSRGWFCVTTALMEYSGV